MQKKAPLLHPILFSCYPILYFYDQNKHEVWFLNTITPWSFSILLAGVLFFIFYLLNKEKHKAGVSATFCLVLFFSHSSFLQVFNQNVLGRWILNKDSNLFLSYLVLLVIVIFLIKKSQKDFSKISYVLNFFTALLLIFPIINIMTYQITMAKSGTSENNEISNISANFSGKVKPDIYFIILDAYAREDILKELYNFDNRDFIQFLENSGFYIGHKSRANYPVTVPSLASILNMEYIETRKKNMEINKNEQLSLYSRVEDNKVVKFLKSQGYKYIHFTSDVKSTAKNKNSDVTMTSFSWVSPFTVAFAGNTFLKTLNLSVLDPIKIRQDTILYEFDQLAEIPKDKSPTFTFAHIMMPHGPIVFDEKGNTPENTEDTLKGYLKFLQFANKKTKQTIKSIISGSESPPVIILQSDHGTEFQGQCLQPDLNLIKERMAILNAYFVPDEVRKHLYESISPVNSFRVLFNHYFGAELDLFEDKIFFTYCYGNIYQPVRVPDEKYLNSSKEWIKALEDTVQQFPGNYLASNTLGIEYYNEGRLEEAEKYLKLVLKSKKFTNLAYKNLGKVYSSQKKNREAIEAFKKSLALNSKSNYVKLLLAEVLIDENEKDEAKFYIEKVANSSSLVEYEHRGLADLYFKIGDIQNEIKHYKKIIRSYGHYSEIHMKLGGAYDQLENGKDAIIHTKIAGQLYSDEKKIKEAKKMEKKFKDLLIKYNFSANDFTNVRLIK